MSAPGVDFDFDFAKWIAARRGSVEAQEREGAAYAFANERKFRRTLQIARPVTIAIEATTRLWRDAARSELLASATKVTDEQFPRVFEATKHAAAALRVRAPMVFAAAAEGIKVKVLGTEDAPHLIVDLSLAETLDDTELLSAIAHELAHLQNGCLPYATALHYLTHRAIFFVRWIVQPAIMTLQAWSRRAEITCDRASLLAVKDLDKTLRAMVRLELGDEAAAKLDPAAVEPTASGIAKLGELWKSKPFIGKRIAALKLFADSELYARVVGADPSGKQSVAAVDKLVANLI